MSETSDDDARDLAWLVGIPEAERDVARAEVEHWTALRKVAETEAAVMREERDVYRRAEIRLEAERDRLRALAVRLRDTEHICGDPLPMGMKCPGCVLFRDSEVRAL